MHVMRCLLSALSIFLFAGILSAQVNYNYTFYSTSGGAAAFGAAAADFNRDGFPDLAVGEINGSGIPAIDIFTNDGTGHFAFNAEYPVAFTPFQIIAADLNGDGYPDLIVSWAPGSTSGTPFLDTFLNNGNGTFSPGPQIGLKAAVVGPIAAGDFNGDGKVDLVVEEFNSGNGTDQFEILLGNGNGSFSSRQVLAMSSTGSKPVIADFNRDGKLDIANVEPTKGKALVWWGNGNGSFATPTIFTVPAGSEDITTADFNNDGLADLAVVSCGSACANNAVYVYKNNGNKTFTRESSFTTRGGSLFTADLNGDGFQDIISENGSTRNGSVNYALGKGNFTFGPQVSSASDSPNDFVARDLNLDSRKDIIIPEQVPGGAAVGLATSGFTNCATPPSSTLSAKICTPGNNSRVGSPVTVRASGNSPVGVRRLEIWIDGVKRGQRLYDQIAQSFSLAPGSHRITVVAVDQYVGIAKSTVTVTVP
jgi:hypothetical protein